MARRQYMVRISIRGMGTRAWAWVFSMPILLPCWAYMAAHNPGMCEARLNTWIFAAICCIAIPLFILQILNCVARFALLCVQYLRRGNKQPLKGIIALSSRLWLKFKSTVYQTCILAALCLLTCLFSCSIFGFTNHGTVTARTNYTLPNVVRNLAIQAPEFNGMGHGTSTRIHDITSQCALPTYIGTVLANGRTIIHTHPSFMRPLPTDDCNYDFTSTTSCVKSDDSITSTISSPSQTASSNASECPTRLSFSSHDDL